jgi:hypothetical protein
VQLLSIAFEALAHSEAALAVTLTPKKPRSGIHGLVGAPGQMAIGRSHTDPEAEVRLGEGVGIGPRLGLTLEDEIRATRCRCLAWMGAAALAAGQPNHALRCVDLLQGMQKAEEPVQGAPGSGRPAGQAAQPMATGMRLGVAGSDGTGETAGSPGCAPAAAGGGGLSAAMQLMRLQAALQSLVNSTVCADHDAEAAGTGRLPSERDQDRIVSVRWQHSVSDVVSQLEAMAVDLEVPMEVWQSGLDCVMALHGPSRALAERAGGATSAHSDGIRPSSRDAALGPIPSGAGGQHHCGRSSKRARASGGAASSAARPASIAGGAGTDGGVGLEGGAAAGSTGPAPGPADAAPAASLVAAAVGIPAPLLLPAVRVAMQRLGRPLCEEDASSGLIMRRAGDRGEAGHADGRPQLASHQQPPRGEGRAATRTAAGGGEVAAASSDGGRSNDAKPPFPNRPGEARTEPETRALQLHVASHFLLRAAQQQERAAAACALPSGPAGAASALVPEGSQDVQDPSREAAASTAAAALVQLDSLLQQLLLVGGSSSDGAGSGAGGTPLLAACVHDEETETGLRVNDGDAAGGARQGAAPGGKDAVESRETESAAVLAVGGQDAGSGHAGGGVAARHWRRAALRLCREFLWSRGAASFRARNLPLAEELFEVGA